MSKEELFGISISASENPENPESLFSDLRKDPVSNLKHLWSHQADLLRDYNTKHLNTSDIALELPTGSGKTLIGLLIGEFRRRKFDERVVYLCPTKQLAYQVGNHAREYGITANVLVGTKYDYPPKNFTDYARAKAIAITTYSGLFNISPGISDPQTIILDDAHASEDYISSMWSVEIKSKDFNVLFNSIIAVFRDVLPTGFGSELSLDFWKSLELIPGYYFRQRKIKLYALLENSLPQRSTPRYSWDLIKNNLNACNLFISHTTILIRPLIPPTKNHSPFSNANQRVYMSATLGVGGELERITGVQCIGRLPIPQGWQKKGSGHRLILFPGLSDEDISFEIVLKSITEAKRALVLVPNNQQLEQLKSIFISKNIEVLDKESVEFSLDDFVNKENCALVLANRYDGLDLPDEACRVLVVSGKPCGANLQEAFLSERLRASYLLRDRILTRISQGFGRCTRSDSDYAVIIILGRELTEFLVKMDNRICLHPELQAELELGIDISSSINEEKFQKLINALLKQTEDWAKAVDKIITLRSTKNREEDEVASKLMTVVQNEIKYVYYLWNDDLQNALNQAKQISDLLSEKELKEYCGLWCYFHGDCALMLYSENNSQSLLDTARDSFRRASSCALAITWLSKLSRIVIEGQSEGIAPEVDILTTIAIERITIQLEKLGSTGRKFNDMLDELIKSINDNKHSSFHRGLEILGLLLGFNAYIPPKNGSPDCIWSLEDLIHIVFEAKTEKLPENPISKKDVQQAEGHRNWIEYNSPYNSDTTIISVIVGCQNSIYYSAMPHTGDLYFINPDLLKDIAIKISFILTNYRARYNTPNEQTNEELVTELERYQLLPMQLIDQFQSQRVSQLDVIDNSP